MTLTDGTVSVHVEIPFGCKAELTLPRSGRETEILSAGAYDFTYTPTKDFRKPFDENTMIAVLGENEQALGILFSLVPPIGGMAKGKNPEFGYSGLAEAGRQRTDARSPSIYKLHDRTVGVMVE